MLIKQSMEAGLQFYKSGEFRLAIREFSKVSSESSEYFGALYNRSLCHRALKGYRRAIEDLKNALKINPGAHMALLALGMNYFDIYDYENAEKAFDAVTKKKTDFVDAFVYLGRTHQARQKYKLAIKSFTRAIAINPQNTRVRVRRARVYHMVGNYELALKDYKSVMDLHPDDPQVLRFRAESLQARYRIQRDSGDLEDADNVDDLDEAMAYCQKAIRLDEDSVWGYYRISLIHQDLGNHDLAIANLDTAIALNQDMHELFKARADSYRLIGLDDDALTDYGKAIQLNPLYSEAFFERGSMYRKQDKFKAAITELDEAILIDEGNWIAFQERGLCRRDTVIIEDQEKAVADFSKAIQLRGEELSNYKFRGQVHLALGNHYDAVDDLSRYLEVFKDEFAFFDRGKSYRFLGDDQQSIDNFSSAIELNPDFGAAILERAQVKQNLNLHPAAIEDYDRLINLRADESTYYRDRGYSYQQNGMHQEAIIDFGISLNLNKWDQLTFYRRGVSYQVLNQHIAAVEEFTEAIRICSENGDNLIARSVSYQVLGDKKAADADIRQADQLRD